MNVAQMRAVWIPHPPSRAPKAAGMTCALDEMVNGLKILSWLYSDRDKG